MLSSSIPYGKSIYHPISIVIIFFQLVLTVIFGVYVNSILKYKTWYPIRELSPILTILQQIGLYLFSVLTLLLIWCYITDFEVDFMVRIVSFIQIVSRGIFILASLFKALKIFIAFNYDLETWPCLLKFMENDGFIVLAIVTLVCIIWCLPYAIYYFSMQTFFIVEEELIICSIFVLFEIIIAFVIIYLNYHQQHKFEAFKKYIFLPLVAYAFALYINFLLFGVQILFFNDLDSNQFTITYMVLLIWIIQLIRSSLCFIFMTIYPIKKCVDFRSPFTPSIVLVNLCNFLEEEICRTVFNEYFEFKQSQDLDIYNYFCELKYAKELGVVGSFQNLVDSTKYDQIWKKLKIPEQLINSNVKGAIDIIYLYTYQFLNSIYQNSYKITKSYDTLSNLYIGYERAVINFHRLKLQSGINSFVVENHLNQQL